MAKVNLKKSNLRVEKPEKHYFGQTIKGNVNSDVILSVCTCQRIW